MTTTHTAFDSYSRPSSLDAADNLLAFPSFGSLFTRMKTSLGNQVQAAVLAQADTRFWDAAPSDARVQSEISRASEHSEQGHASPLQAMVPASVAARKPLNNGLGSMIHRGYQTRFHNSSAQHA